MRYALLIHYPQPAPSTLTEEDLEAGKAAFPAYAKALDDAGVLRPLRTAGSLAGSFFDHHRSLWCAHRSPLDSGVGRLPGPFDVEGTLMIGLYDAERGTRLGEISEEQLRRLTDSLEEESPTDQDYYLTAATIDMLEADGADAELVSLLRGALAGREGMDVRWARE